MEEKNKYECESGQVGFGHVNYHRSRLHDSPAVFGSQEAGPEQADREVTWNMVFIGGINRGLRWWKIFPFFFPTAEYVVSVYWSEIVYVRRKAWQPTPVFLPGKSHEQKSLAGYSPCGQKESDMTELTRQVSKYVLNHLVNWKAFNKIRRYDFYLYSSLLLIPYSYLPDIFFCFYFCLSIVDLQCFVAFYYTAKWFIHIHAFLFTFFFHYGLSQGFEYHSLYYTVGSFLSILYIIVCIC